MPEHSLFCAEYKYGTERRMNVAVSSVQCSKEVDDQLHGLTNLLPRENSPSWLQVDCERVKESIGS
jgi:hypothetical protein